MVKKRTDFAARLVASALPEIPPLSATIPWGALLNLFAPFVIHEIEKDPNYDESPEELMEKYKKLHCVD